MAARWKDDIHDEKRDLENKVIEERIRLRKIGFRAGEIMDRHIQSEEWYIHRKEILDLHRADSDLKNGLQATDANSRVGEERRLLADETQVIRRLLKQEEDFQDQYKDFIVYSAKQQRAKDLRVNSSRLACCITG